METVELERSAGSLDELRFEISIRQCQSRVKVVMVAITGDYWSESGSENAGAIEMIVAAALASPRGPGKALVCDLSRLSYRGGDGLLGWRHLPARLGLTDYRIAVVSSAENHDTISSLIEDEDDSALAELLHPDLDSALAAVCSSGR